MGDAIGAEKNVRQGTRRAPGYAACYSYFAGSLIERNDLKGAERVLQRAIKLEGADGECYCSLGGGLREEKETGRFHRSRSGIPRSRKIGAERLQILSRTQVVSRG